MGYQRQTRESRGYFLPYHRKRIGLVRIAMSQTMNFRGPVAIIIRGWANQLIKRVRYLLIFYYYNPNAAYAFAVAVGRFKIYCRKIIHVIPL